MLVDLAEEVGIDRTAAAELLASDDQITAVNDQRQEAYGDGINAVPTFVVEGEWMLQGALETDKWVRAPPHDRRWNSPSGRAL